MVSRRVRHDWCLTKHSPRLPGGFPGGSGVKNPPAKQETQVRSVGGEDPLENELATPSSILAWEIPWTEESGGLQSSGVAKQLDTTEQLK